LVGRPSQVCQGWPTAADKVPFLVLPRRLRRPTL